MNPHFSHPFRDLPLASRKALLAYGLWVRLSIGGALLCASGIALLFDPGVHPLLALGWVGAGAAIAALSWPRAEATLRGARSRGARRVAAATA